MVLVCRIPVVHFPSIHVTYMPLSFILQMFVVAMQCIVNNFQSYEPYYYITIALYGNYMFVWSESVTIAQCSI